MCWSSWCLYHGNKVATKLEIPAQCVYQLVLPDLVTPRIGARKTWSLQQVSSGSLKNLFVFLSRTLLRSADNLQSVRKEKFVFLLWLFASLPETL